MSITFTPSISGCAETEKGMATRSLLNRPNELVITPLADGFRFHHALTHQCCRKAELTHRIEEQVITIFETWGGEGCRCMCFSELDAQLTGLERSGYHIQIIECGRLPNGTPMPERIIHKSILQVGG